jgi:hypothetical protein
MNLLVLSCVFNKACIHNHSFHHSFMQVTLSSEALYKQHVTGPVHRKALEKQQAEQARMQHMSVYQDAAQAALGAAAWTSTHGGGGASASGAASQRSM